MCLFSNTCTNFSYEGKLILGLETAFSFRFLKSNVNLEWLVLSPCCLIMCRSALPAMCRFLSGFETPWLFDKNAPCWVALRMIPAFNRSAIIGLRSSFTWGFIVRSLSITEAPGIQSRSASKPKKCPTSYLCVENALLWLDIKDSISCFAFGSPICVKSTSIPMSGGTKLKASNLSSINDDILVWSSTVIMSFSWDISCIILVLRDLM